jgi:hypothetical protein
VRLPVGSFHDFGKLAPLARFIMAITFRLLVSAVRLRLAGDFLVARVFVANFTFLALRGPFVTGASASGMLAFSKSMRLGG